jgi:tetratricopeptide (TPR) repeat protein
MTRFAAAVLVIGCVTLACNRDPAARARELERKADGYAARQQWKEAIIEYSNAIKAAPNAAGLHDKRARAYSASGDARAAYAGYARAADLDPSNVDAQLRAGDLLLAANDFEGARARAERALAVDRRNVAAHVLLGNALIGSNEPSQALKQIEEALKLDPSSPAAWVALGATRATEGRATEARVAFEKAVALDPSSIDARLSLANALWSARDVSAAERELLELASRQPHSPIPQRALAAFYVSTGRAAAAEMHIKALATDDAGRLALGDYYTQLGRWSDARTVLEPLAKSSKKETARTARLRLAAVAYSTGAKDDAYRSVDALIAEQPHRIEARLVKTRMLLQDGDLTAADHEAAGAIAQNSGSPEAHFLAGVAAERRGDVARAEKSFDEVVRINPRAAPAYVRLAGLRLKRGEPAAAVTAARRAVALAPDDREAAILMARGLRAKGDAAGAVDYLKPLAEKNPADAVIQVELGWAYLQNRRAANATAAFNEALRIQPHAPDAREGLIAADVAAGQMDAARTKVNRWLQDTTAPDSRLLVLAAKIDLASGRTDAAIRGLKEAVAVAPNDLDGYAVLAHLYAAKGQLPEAIEQYQQLAKEPSTAANALTMIGLLEQARGNAAAAQRAYEKALAVNGQVGTAANNLAWLYAESGRLDEARRLATDAERLLRNRPEPVDTIGWVDFKRGEYEQAAAKFLEAINRAPDRATYHYHLALARVQQGRCEEARTSLDRARKFGLSAEDAATLSAAPCINSH